PLQDLDRAADLVVASYHRVELALARALGEVDRVLLERLALSFGFLRIDGRAAAHRLDRRFERLFGQAVLLNEPSGLALVISKRKQEQLAGDELIAALGGDFVGQVEQVAKLARNADLAALPFDLRQAGDRLLGCGLERRNVDTGA